MSRVSCVTCLQFKMRGCHADVLQALLQGKQQLLVDEDSRLAAASVVGIGTSPPPNPPSPPPSRTRRR